MNLVRDASELRREGQRTRRRAFVPTMGNLHDGHLKLVETARRQADEVVVSIYVNPLQFGPAEDFDRYPRTLEADLARLAGHADLVYLPGDTQIYPAGVEAHTRVFVPRLGDVLCGRSRPGHFTGVTTVVSRLLHLVAPEIAVFGKKDYQQWRLIERMVRDCGIDVEVLAVETVRAEDGLALSSRNHYLSPKERAQAPLLAACLRSTARAVEAGMGIPRAEQEARSRLTDAGFVPDYIEVRRPDLEAPEMADAQLVVFGAAYLGTTRLIDNFEFERTI